MDLISICDVNLIHYYKREEWKETGGWAAWGYVRISKHRQNIVLSMTYEDKNLFDLVKQVIQEADSDEAFLHRRIDTWFSVSNDI